jgi:hypothetical protein
LANFFQFDQTCPEGCRFNELPAGDWFLPWGEGIEIADRIKEESIVIDYSIANRQLILANMKRLSRVNQPQVWGSSILLLNILLLLIVGYLIYQVVKSLKNAAIK